MNLDEFREYLRTQDALGLSGEASILSHDYTVFSRTAKTEEERREIDRLLQEIKDKLRLIDQELAVKDPKGYKRHQAWREKHRRLGDLTFDY